MIGYRKPPKELEHFLMHIIKVIFFKLISTAQIHCAVTLLLCIH